MDKVRPFQPAEVVRPSQKVEIAVESSKVYLRRYIRQVIRMNPPKLSQFEEASALAIPDDQARQANPQLKQGYSCESS